ncbi:MAG: hypothetical protein ACTSWY_04430 [Promethearchaeota archaeon]
MNFNSEIRTTIRTIPLKDYYSMICPFCDNPNTIIRSSYTRKIQDLGSPFEKIIVHLKVAYIKCPSCKAKFTPEHPSYPPKLEYSRAIVDYALMRYHYENTSGNIISKSLNRGNNVNIPEATIYSWLKEYSPQFLKYQIDSSAKNKDLSQIKTITVDGSYVSVGKDVIGKKKDVESLSVTKLKDGRYLLMWWE